MVCPIYFLQIAVLCFLIFLVDHCTKDDVLCFIHRGKVTQNIKTFWHDVAQVAELCVKRRGVTTREWAHITVHVCWLKRTSMVKHFVEIHLTFTEMSFFVRQSFNSNVNIMFSLQQIKTSIKLHQMYGVGLFRSSAFN